MCKYCTREIKILSLFFCCCCCSFFAFFVVVGGGGGVSYKGGLYSKNVKLFFMKFLYTLNLPVTVNHDTLYLLSSVDQILSKFCFLFKTAFT